MEFRPSKQIKLEIKSVTDELLSLNARLKSLNRQNESLSDEKKSLDKKIAELKKLIESGNGTPADVLLVRQYTSRQDEIESILRENVQLKQLYESQNEEDKKTLQDLQKELEETLVYEAALKLRLSVTLVDTKSDVNSLLPTVSNITIPKGTEIEILSDGDVRYIKIGSLSDVLSTKNGVMKLNEIDYTRISTSNDSHSSAPSPATPEIIHGFGDGFDLPTFLTYTKVTYDFDLDLSFRLNFLLFDSQFLHTDNSIWGEQFSGLIRG